MDPLDIEMRALHEQSPTNNVQDLNFSLDIIANADELDQALIHYITQTSRLLFVEREETWTDFHNASAENSEKYNDFTTEQICDYFMRKVLPNIYNYELTSLQEQMLKLLNLHPELERTTNGYARMPIDRRIGFERRPKEGEDFAMVEHTQKLRKILNEEDTKETETTTATNQEFNLTPPKHSPTHNLLLQVPYERQGRGYYNHLSSETAALLSAALSNDFELSGRVLLEPREIHRRLREAKREFEENGRLPPNLLDAEKLVEKIKKLTKLREAVVDVVANRF